MKTSRRIATSVVALICLASLGLTVLAAIRYYGYERSIVEPLKEDLILRTRAAAGQIDRALTPARAAAESMAAELDRTAEPTERQLIDLLRESILSDEACFGGTVAFEPYRFSSDARLYAPYFSRVDGELEFERIEDSYDYTDESQEWYVKALAEGPRWSEPYFDTAVGNALMTTYSAIFHEQGTPRGVVTIDVSMDSIRRIVRALDLGGMGHAVLVTDQGQIVYHPDEELVLGGVNLVDRASAGGDEVLTALARKILEGGSGIADHTAPLTGLDTWFVYEPVASTGWTLIGAFVKEDAPVETAVLRRSKVRFGASLVLFGATAAALLLNALAGQRRRLWALSIVVSFLFVVGIGFTWKAALDYDSDEDVAGRIVTDIAGLKSFQEALIDQSRDRLTDTPVFVPTGVLIDSLRFDGGTDFDVRGYVWQRFAAGNPDNVDPGFTLVGVSALEIGEPAIDRAGDIEVIRWSFELSQRVRFESSKFPLMRDRFAIHIVPHAIASNVVLVPDLSAYPILSPATSPGLHENVYLPGWEITRTFFELREHTPATDYGLGGSASNENYPSLYFNIEVRKEFIDTFVSNLVPLIIVAVVVFLVLLINEREEEHITLMRTGPGFNLSICGTLLFVAVFSHIGVRQKIAAQEIIYLEAFYIVMYFALLWVAVNSILYVRWPESKFIQYERNLLPKVLFWPVTLGALWVVTLLTFY
jgi:hypothetical protein